MKVANKLSKKGLKSSGDNPWMSISDLMSGLMMVFMLISVMYMIQVQNEQKKQDEMIQEYAIVKQDIYDALLKEFESDLPKWNARIDKKTLAITFVEPDVLFDVGSSALTPKFQNILNDFFPRYLSILQRDEFKNSIEEIRIEGHTDPYWKGAQTRKEEYMQNMDLSQQRTRSVLLYALTQLVPDKDLEWVISKITANGLSSSQPVKNDNDTINAEASRRVEFRVRTNADEKLNNLQERIH